MNLFKKHYIPLAIGSVFALVTPYAIAVDVPVTKLTKSCKPLVDTNLKIKDPAFTGYSERVHTKLTRAQERLADNKYDEGIELLKSLLESAPNDYVKSTVNVQLAYAYAQSGKQELSYPYFQKALELGESTLPNQTVQSLRQNVAGFMFNNGDKQEAVKLMETWMKKSNIERADAYYLLAAMYSDDEVKRLKDAACPAMFAVKAEDKPKEHFFSILLNVHLQLSDMQGAAIILKKMISYFPDNKDYWRNLTQVYLQLDKQKDSLAIMEMFYLQNKFDKENDYKTLAQLFSFERIPYRAAKILEEGIKKGIVKSEDKNWRAVAMNYHASNDLDEAIVAYGETAKLAEDGKDYYKQGELFSDTEKWNQAVEAFDKALQKGKLDDVGRAYLRKGVALINKGSCDSGIKSLEQAAKYKKHRSSANGWTSYAQDKLRLDKC
jgi:tetratricopeptide (TPR) repeat protein